MRRICVFCGSSDGARPSYAAAARELAVTLADRKIGLVYGGGNVGLMGVIADASLSHNGAVIGVIPERLRALEVAHEGLPDLRVVDSMHARKALMADLSDGFIALPGGLGTLEELFEVATWNQLGFHNKPVGLLNVAGYFDGLRAWLEHAVSEGFLRPQHRRRLIFDKQPAALVEAMIAAWESADDLAAAAKWTGWDQR